MTAETLGGLTSARPAGLSEEGLNEPRMEGDLNEAGLHR